MIKNELNLRSYESVRHARISKPPEARWAVAYGTLFALLGILYWSVSVILEGLK